MELRFTRSKSKTPFGSVKEGFEGNSHWGVEKTIIRKRSTKAKTITVVSSDDESITNINHNVDLHAERPGKAKAQRSVRKTRYKTSDYSSEDGSSRTEEQNSQNQHIENMRRSASRASDSSVSAIDFYRAAGDYWNKYPKTDYTYSPHSRDRKELAPGVVAMPNMSRKSLHTNHSDIEYIGTHKQTMTSFEHEEEDYLNSNYLARPKTSFGTQTRSRAYLNHHSEERYAYLAAGTKKKTLVRRFLSVFTSIFSYVFSLVYWMYKAQNSTFVWVGKKIHQAATRVMLWDTQLLQASRSTKKMTSVLALCLIPLAILGGWWLLTGLGSPPYREYSTPLTAALPNTGATDSYISRGDKRDLDWQKLEEKIAELIGTMVPQSSRSEVTSEQLQEIANSVQISLDADSRRMDALVAQILQSPSIQNVINNYNRLAIDLKESKEQGGKDSNEDILHNQQVIIDNLKEEIGKIKVELLHRDDEIAKVVAQLQLDSARSSARLMHQLNRCCRHSAIHMENYVTRLLKDLLGVPNHLSSAKDISDWLHTAFVARKDLDLQLTNLTEHLKTDYSDLIEVNSKIIMDEVMARISKRLAEQIERIQASGNLNEISISAPTDEHIRKIVSESLALYDADKTGLVDYALESAGGHVLSTRCTESYQARTAVLSVFGIPLWYPTNTPRTVITPGMTPGECWAFQNFPGFLLVKLSTPVQIEAFSIEHISKLLAPNGKIDSAPKDFSVYGLRSETDKDPVLLGKYVYDYNGPSLQYFIAEVAGLVFDIVELRIFSNNGNPNYTCLYRFRVHGTPKDKVR